MRWKKVTESSLFRSAELTQRLLDQDARQRREGRDKQRKEKEVTAESEPKGSDARLSTATLPPSSSPHRSKKDVTASSSPPPTKWMLKKPKLGDLYTGLGWKVIPLHEEKGTETASLGEECSRGSEIVIRGGKGKDVNLNKGEGKATAKRLHDR